MLENVVKIVREGNRSKGGKYDCIIGVSGGLDSTYVLYTAKKKLGLNPLAVKYNNGFAHEVAQKNIVQACEKLSVDLIMVEKVALESTYILNAIKATREIGIFFSICFSCHYTIAAVVYKIARQYDIPFMLTNTNPYEDKLSKSSHGLMLKSLFTAFIKAPFKNKIRYVWFEALALVSLLRLKYAYDGFSLRFFRNVFRLHPVPHDELRKINISEYQKWDLCAMRDELKKELGWESPHDTKMPYMRFDCDVLNLVNYSFWKTTGVSEHGILCNFFIEDGKMTREEGEKDFSYFNDEKRYICESNKVLKKLGLRIIE